jgi:hypothetical protein
MHMVTNISLDLLIGVQIQIDNFIMMKIVWLFIDKKIHLLDVMDFWSWKIWIGHLIGMSQNGKHYIHPHSKFVIGIQYMIYYEIVNSNEKSFS